MPPGKAPPSGLAGLSLLNLPSMLQSCGKLSKRQFASFKLVFSPSLTSPNWKCHPLSKSETDRPCWLNPFKTVDEKIKVKQSDLPAFSKKALENSIIGLI